MPATFGIAAVSIAGKARSYGTRLSLFVVPACSFLRILQCPRFFILFFGRICFNHRLWVAGQDARQLLIVPLQHCVSICNRG